MYKILWSCTLGLDFNFHLVLFHPFRSYLVYFSPPLGPIRPILSILVLFGPVQSYSVLFALNLFCSVHLVRPFCPLWSYSVLFSPIRSHSVHLCPIQLIRSTLVHQVLFGPIRSIWSSLVLSGPHWSFQSTSVQLCPFCLNSVHFGPIQSTSVLFSLFCPLCSYSIHFSLIQSTFVWFGRFGLIRSSSVHFGPFNAFGPFLCTYIIEKRQVWVNPNSLKKNIDLKLVICKILNITFIIMFLLSHINVAFRFTLT